MTDWNPAEIERLRRAPRGRPAGVPRAGPGQESVWDFPRPPRVDTVERRVRVEHAGTVIAETAAALRVCETASPPAYYLPPDDVRTSLLTPSSTRTVCEWKGTAYYWDLRIGDAVVRDAAWSYPDPWKGFEVIRDHVAFFASRVDACWVGADRVTPQPGGFYGGWITPDIVGPFKGAPGTGGW